MYSDSNIESLVGESARLAAEHLLRIQQPDGHWVGEIEGDTILESEWILMASILGDKNEVKLHKAAEYIRRKQLPCGGWAIYPNGPPDISASVKAYFALKLTGTSPDEEIMRRAKQCILDMGGAGRCNSYTMFYLAALGQVDWDVAPAVPPEIVLLPRWFYFNLYEISSWSRTFVVPLSIIWSHKPVVQLPPDAGISELFAPDSRKAHVHRLVSWKRMFLMADRLVKFAECHNIHPWRRLALSEAEAWLLKHLEKSAGLGGIYPPMVYTIIAMRCLNYPEDHPELMRARWELEQLEIEDERTLRLQPCKSPVWDTAIALNAISCFGSVSENPRVVDAVQWVLSKEVRTRGDWSLKRPKTEPGGWYFEYANEFYPDIDDTAMMLLALKNLKTFCPGTDDVRARAINWMMAMQGKDGGWASFDADNNRRLFCSIPFADHNAMIDPSTSDITARVLETLGAYGYDESHPSVKRAVQFLLREQESDGSWFGRWGVNYIYGTSQVLRGLLAIGVAKDHPCITRGVSWLIAHQNADGGWGESIVTYDDPSLRGKGESTASQTAWAVMGMLAAGLCDHQAVSSGIKFLVRTQTSDGTWEEDQWTGTGFPSVFYLRYDLYRHSFPLWALGMYLKCKGLELDFPYGK